MKAVAKFVIFWDPCIFLIAPHGRKVREYCRSNLTGSERLYAALAEIWTRGGTYEEIFDMIDTYTEPARLCSFMTGGQRDVAWNFQQTSRSRGWRSPSGTVEYRRPPGSRELREVYQAVTLGLCFVRGAVRFTAGVQLSELYVRMCQTRIIFTADEFNGNRESLPPELIKFGNDHFDEFVAWMKLMAGELGMIDDLITRPSKE